MDAEWMGIHEIGTKLFMMIANFQVVGNNNGERLTEKETIELVELIWSLFARSQM